jgi:FtsP/CotA-like multicopper oxidase with cupredoxin domain
VTNKLENNGTSIHWHGIRQWKTNDVDGVNGITECPLAPGDSKTYTFQATQFGTSWWHSHFSAQYGDGVLGAIQINGPASANYDIDLGTYLVQDWYYSTVYQIEDITTQNLQSGQGPPPADNILINGTNKNAAGGGRYNKVKLTKGKKHRLRLVNTSVDNMIRVSLDNHQFQVITADFVPIHPFTANWILLGIGQRYDVIINANQTSDNYWFRAETAQDCASSNNWHGRSIFTYSDATEADPTTNTTTIPNVCQDESPLVPWWKTTVPSADFDSQVQDMEVDINVEQVTTNNQSIVIWGVNLTAIDIAWEKPTLEYVVESNTSYPTAYNLIELPTPNIWTYWIIQETDGTPVPIPHPVHLHGHDVG